MTPRPLIVPSRARRSSRAARTNRDLPVGDKGRAVKGGAASLYLKCAKGTHF
jgi:hypothetical protein